MLAMVSQEEISSTSFSSEKNKMCHSQLARSCHHLHASKTAAVCVLCEEGSGLNIHMN